MLEPFISEFSTLSHLDTFHFGTVLSDGGKIGNILGEFILAHSADLNPSGNYTTIHPFLTPLFVHSIFGYPFQHWGEIIETHPEYKAASQPCKDIKYDKLYICSRIWLQEGFKIPDEGVNDNIETQLYNAETLLSMPVDSYKLLQKRTHSILYLSGLFGTNICLEANFH